MFSFLGTTQKNVEQRLLVMSGTFQQLLTATRFTFTQTAADIGPTNKVSITTLTTIFLTYCTKLILFNRVALKSHV